MIYLLMGNNKIWQIVAVSVGVASIAIGIGIPFFYESQIDSAVSVFPFISFIPFSFFRFSLSLNVPRSYPNLSHIMRVLERELKGKTVFQSHHKLLKFARAKMRAQALSHTERLCD